VCSVRLFAATAASSASERIERGAAWLGGRQVGSSTCASISTCLSFATNHSLLCYQSFTPLLLIIHSFATNHSLLCNK
jgi:hypothetical protein